MALVLSLLMLTGFALIAGAIWLYRRRGMTRQIWLMLLLALVVAVNIGIWTLPDGEGQTLMSGVPVNQ